VFLSKNHLVAEPKNTRNVKYIIISSLKGKYLGAFSYFSKCTLYVLEHIKNFDVFHIHNSDFGIFSIVISKCTRKMIVGTFHGDPYLRNKWSWFAKVFLKVSERAFINGCNILTSVAKTKVDNKVRSGLKIIHYIPNGIEDYSTINSKNDDIFKKYSLVDSSYYLFACGRLDSTKGLHHIINAITDIESLNMPLVVVGDFSHDLTYSKEIEFLSNQSSKEIIFIKHLLSKKDLVSLIKSALFFVFPSEVEAMSMMLLEVISCKTPVICSDISENVEIMGTQYNYLFKSCNSSDLRKKILEILTDENQIEQAGELQKIVLAKFSWELIANQYLKIYQTNLETHYN